MSNAIEFKFIENRFDYKLPLVGVDVEFLNKRRAEVYNCLYELAKVVGAVNIASKEGVADFDKCNKLVKYYHYALITINSKHDALVNGKRKITQAEIDLASRLSSRID